MGVRKQARIARRNMFISIKETETVHQKFVRKTFENQIGEEKKLRKIAKKLREAQRKKEKQERTLRKFRRDQRIGVGFGGGCRKLGFRRRIGGCGMKMKKGYRTGLFKCFIVKGVELNLNAGGKVVVNKNINTSISQQSSTNFGFGKKQSSFGNKSSTNKEFKLPNFSGNKSSNIDQSSTINQSSIINKSSTTVNEYTTDYESETVI